MKKSITILLCLLLFLFTTNTAYANGNTVTFTSDCTLLSNFSDDELSAFLNNLLPGECASFEIFVHNDFPASATFYMSSKVLEAFDNLNCGVMDYSVSFISSNGSEHILLTSSSGGRGEYPLSIYEANEPLENYYFLATLGSGDSGIVRLNFQLDGDSFSNEYQSTKLSISLDFAAEIEIADLNSKENQFYKSPQTGVPDNDSFWRTIQVIAAVTIILLLCLKLKKKFFFVLIFISFSIGICIEAKAYYFDDYSYTVRLYGGNHGVINGSSYVSYDCNYGEQFSIGSDIVEIDYPDKYFFCGFKEAGEDNSHLYPMSFLVTEDIDLIAVYGRVIPDKVLFTVNYVDEFGYFLKSSDVYYGTLGSDIVIPAKYIEGYTPVNPVVYASINDNTEIIFMYSERSTALRLFQSTMNY